MTPNRMEIPRVSEILNPENVAVIDPADKSDAIRQTMALLRNHPAIHDYEAFTRAILKREELVSTGIGVGVAVPHAKIAEIGGYVLAVSRCVRPVDFDSIDGEPVQLLFVIGASDRAALTFVRFLAQIVHMVKDGARRAALLEAPDARAIYERMVKDEV